MNRVRGILAWGILALGLSIFGSFLMSNITKAAGIEAVYYEGDQNLVIKGEAVSRTFGANEIKLTKMPEGMNGHDGWRAENLNISCSTTDVRGEMVTEHKYTGNIYVERLKANEGWMKLTLDGECNRQSSGLRDKFNSTSESGNSPNTTNPAGDPKETPEETGSENNCSVPGLGWLVCPLVNLLGGASDAMYGMVSAMLEIDSSMFDANNEGRGSATYEIWKGMRNLANAIFVIMFLILIYSYLSGAGFSNYTIKKTLPRILVAALLVNISFYICAILVDISNISGSTLKTLLDNQTSKIEVSDKFGDQGNFFSSVAAAIIVGAPIAGALSWAGVLVVLPTLVTVAAAIFTAFIVLAFRSALIVILTIISPLAFVSILLPNTEQWFNRWRKLFTTLILMYPAIALVFGGSAFAGKAIMSAANSAEAGDGDFTLAITGALIMVVPLFVTPIIMSTAGNFLGKIAGVVNDKDKGLIDRAYKGAKGLQRRGLNSAKVRALESKGLSKWNPVSKAVRSGVRSRAKLEGSNSALNRAESDFISKEIEGNSGFRNAVAGGGWFAESSQMNKDIAYAGAINTKDKLDRENLSAAGVALSSKNLSGNQIQKMAVSGVDMDGNKVSAIMQRAAIAHQMSSGSDKDKLEIIENSGGSLQEFASEISSHVAPQKDKLGLSGQALERIAQKQIKSAEDLNQAILENAGKGLSPQQIQAMSADAQERLYSTIEGGTSKVPGMSSMDFEAKKDVVYTSARRALDSEHFRNSAESSDIGNMQKITSTVQKQAVSTVSNGGHVVTNENKMTQAMDGLNNPQALKSGSNALSTSQIASAQQNLNAQTTNISNNVTATSNFTAQHSAKIETHQQTGVVKAAMDSIKSGASLSSQPNFSPGNISASTIDSMAQVLAKGPKAYGLDSKDFAKIKKEFEAVAKQVESTGNINRIASQRAKASGTGVGSTKRDLEYTVKKLQ